MPNRWTVASLHWWRRLLPAFLGLLGAVLVVVSTRFTEGLAHQSYDWSHQLSGVNQKALDSSPVVVVYIDRDSYKELELDPTAPWPRELDARLLDRLRRERARAVVMDIVFSAPGTNELANAELARALWENGRAVLGEDLNGSTSSRPGLLRQRVFQLESPIDRFRTNAAAVALANLLVDEDLICRKHFGGMPSIGKRSLAYATADLLGINAGDDAQAQSRWMRYYGPPMQIPHVPFYRALDEQTVPAGYFRNRIVVMGAQPAPGFPNEGRDLWASPFVAVGQPDSLVPGAEIHATELLNLIRGDWLTRVPGWVQALAFLLFGLSAGWWAIRIRPAIAIPVLVASAGAIVVMAVWLMSHHNLWLAWVIPVFIQTPVTIAGGLTVHTIEWFIDRRRAERRIREQAELIDKAQDSIRLFDLEGRLQLANPRARQLFAIEGNGRAALDFQAKTVGTARMELLAHGQWQGEMKRINGNASELILASRWTLIRNEKGEATGILIIDTDITEQKQLEAQLLRAQRMEAVGAIAGGMAHDLNNSLAPLLLGVQLLKRRPGDESTRHTLEQMESSARRGAEMVRQVLSFARGRNAEISSVDTGLLIREMSRLARETFPRNIRVESQIADDLWPIRANATQIHQVLLNLCVNARDAMPDGGSITLVADNAAVTEEEAREIPGGRAGDFVCLMVNDTGGGIPAELRPRLFEAFFTTKPEGKGTGLGLPTVKRIVEMHAGFVRVQSTAGEGASFEVFLPRWAVSEPNPAEQGPPELPRGSGESIVVVADAEGIRKLMADTLVEQGYSVHATGLLSEALAKLGSGEWQPVLLLVDITQAGITGPDLIAAISRMQGRVPSVIVTGEEPSEWGEPTQKITFLRKPLEDHELLTHVNRLLSGTVKPDQK